MYLFHTQNDQQQPVFILVLPFEQKHLAAQAGFTWNRPQQGAWATTDFSMALTAVRNNSKDIIVAADTLQMFYSAGKILPTTYDRFLDKLNQWQPERKTKAAIEAATMSDEKVAAIHQALQNLAMVCDGSLREDNAGFNRNDVEYGHTLANKSQLTRTDAGYGSLLLYKYRGQIGEELYSVIFPEVFEREQLAAEEKAAKKAAREATKLDNAAKKAAPKLHKAGKFCEWSGCDACNAARPVINAINGDPTADHLDHLAARETADTLLVGAADYLEASEVKDIVAAVAEPVKDMIATITTDTARKIAERELGKLNLPVGYTAMPSGKPVVTKPEAVVVMTTEDYSKNNESLTPDELTEVQKLATSLINCFALDFDTTVDMLRALRKIDEPKKAGSEFLKEAWTSAGYNAE